MKQLGIVFLLSLCVFLNGCKLEIEVPNSGRVVTASSHISCAAGQICTVDIPDIFFDETFLAQPDAGFVFKGWKSKTKSFCGNSTAPCYLSTSGFAGNAILTAILNNTNEVFYLEPRFQSSGFESLFIGHSFFWPFAQGMPAHAEAASIVNHSQSLVTNGGSNGAPQALWENTTKRDQIQAVLDSGDIELFVMTYHPDYPTLEGYQNWIDYALAQNPSTRVAIALPWLPNPGDYAPEDYESEWHDFHATTLHDGIAQLRSTYPGTDIFCIPYGQSAAELRNLLAADNLDDVDALVSTNGAGIYRDNFGHADEILEDLGRLVWLNAIYDVDLNTYAHNPGYNADLKAIAQSIMDEHDSEFDAPYR